MKKSIIFSIFVLLCANISAQNPYVLHLEGGGLSAGALEVKKVGNNFVVITDTAFYVNQVVTMQNCTPKKDIVVNNISNKSVLLTESSTNKTDLIKDPGKYIKFEPGNDYKISHGEATWSVLLRKKVKQDLDIVLRKDSIALNIEDSICVNIHLGDTLNISPKSPVSFSTWSDKLTIIRNDSVIADSLIYFGDEVIYEPCYKCNVNGFDFCTGDTLKIKVNDNKRITCVIFKGEDSQATFLYWLLPLILLFILVAFIGRKRIRALLRLRRIKQIRRSKIQFVVENSNKTASADFQRFKDELNSKIKDLLRILPKDLKRKCNSQFANVDKIEDILKGLQFVESKGKNNAIKKSIEIHQYISEHANIWAHDDESVITSEEKHGTSVDENNNSYLFEEMETILNSISNSIDQTNGETVHYIINKDNYELLTNAFARLVENVEKQKVLEVDNARKEEQEIKQSAIDSAVLAEREANASVVSSLRTELAGAEQRAKEAEDSKEEAINIAVLAEREVNASVVSSLRAELAGAEQRAKEAEDSKKEAINTAVQAEREANASVVSSLRAKAAGAEQRAKEAEESKKNAVNIAVLAEREANASVVSSLKAKEAAALQRAKDAENSKKEAVRFAVNKEKEANVVEISRLKSEHNSEVKQLNQRIEEEKKKTGEYRRFADFAIEPREMLLSYAQKAVGLLELIKEARIKAFDFEQKKYFSDEDVAYFYQKSMNKFVAATENKTIQAWLAELPQFAQSGLYSTDKYSQLRSVLGEYKTPQDQIKSFKFRLHHDLMNIYGGAALIMLQELSSLQQLSGVNIDKSIQQYFSRSLQTLRDGLINLDYQVVYVDLFTKFTGSDNFKSVGSVAVDAFEKEVVLEVKKMAIRYGVSNEKTEVIINR